MQTPDTTAVTPFYQDVEFWISFALGSVGLFFSIVSWWQAKGAKKAAEQAEAAAERAAKIVKTQDVLLDITEIITLCTLEVESSFIDANKKLTSVLGKISHSIGVLQDDHQHNEAINNVKGSISKIRDVLMGLNPIYMEEAAIQIKDIQDNNRVYLAIAPNLDILVSHLQELCGNLQGKMIRSN